MNFMKMFIKQTWLWKRRLTWDWFYFPLLWTRCGPSFVCRYSKVHIYACIHHALIVPLTVLEKWKPAASCLTKDGGHHSLSPLHSLLHINNLLFLTSTSDPSSTTCCVEPLSPSSPSFWGSSRRLTTILCGYQLVAVCFGSAHSGGLFSWCDCLNANEAADHLFPQR